MNAMRPRQDGVLAFVRANPGATISQIYEALRRADVTMTYDSVCKAARKLIACNELDKRGAAVLYHSKLYVPGQSSDATSS